MTNEHTAKVTGRELSISTKHCIEIGNLIRGKSVKRVKAILEGVIDKKVAVPMKLFNFDTGHKRGAIGPGRYPENASKEILALIKSAEMNAQNKGLNTDALYLKVYIANKGSSQWRFGRQRRRQAKRTNLEMVLEERESIVKKETPKKAVTPKEVPKVETPKKTVTPKEVPKVETPKEEKKVEEK